MDSTSNQNPDHERVHSYASLRDYVRVLQRHRLLIVAITLLCGAGAFAYSLTQPERFNASASLSFRDPLADLDLIGLDSTPEDAPSIRAAANAELITRDAVSERAAELVGGEQTPAQLAAMVSGQVAPQTNLVIVTARAGNGQLASDLANGFAKAAREVGSQDVRERLQQAEDSVLDELKQARKDEDVTPLELQTLQTRLNTIGALRSIARPVEIAQRAGVPGSPTSPKPLRNTSIGLLIGLLLGVVAAFARDALDRRFRTVHDVHQRFDLPILGRIPASAFGYSGLLATNGLLMHEAEFEPFRVLRTNLSYLSQDEPLRSILVTSGMPEEGKTTVSMALASAAALGGSRVLLVEVDLRRPSLARRMSLPEGPGLADFLRDEAGPEEIVRTVPITDPWRPDGNGTDQRAGAGTSESYFACITAGHRQSGAVERLGSDRFQDFLASVSAAYDLVILDGSPMLAVVDPLALVPLVDAALLCVRVQQTGADEAHAIAVAFENLPKKPVGLVVTGLRRGGPDSYEYYYGY